MEGEFVVLKVKRKLKGDTCHLIGPLIAKVRQWGDGKNMDSIVSIPKAELQAYFDAIDDLKKRLGFDSKEDDHGQPEKTDE